MKKYESSIKLESGVKIFVVGKAGLNNAKISSSLLYQSCYIHICTCFFLQTLPTGARWDLYSGLKQLRDGAPGV